MSNLKKESETSVLTNIKVIKIIAIILGLLIILGLIVLFLGLAKNYNKKEKFDQKTEIIPNTIKDKLNSFNFLQPSDAQLISSSLGEHNQILLRYIYKGNNVLVILDANTNNIKSIITLKKEIEKW